MANISIPFFSMSNFFTISIIILDVFSNKTMFVLHFNMYSRFISSELHAVYSSNFKSICSYLPINIPTCHS